MRQCPPSALAVEQAEHGLRVADVDGEDHRALPPSAVPRPGPVVEHVSRQRLGRVSRRRHGRAHGRCYHRPRTPAGRTDAVNAGNRAPSSSSTTRTPSSSSSRYNLRKEGYDVAVRQATATRRSRWPRRAALRPRHPRHHAARHRRLRGLPAAAREGRHARAVPVGARHRARQGRRPRDRRATTTSPSRSASASCRRA